MRATAALLDGDHPETVAGGHVRDAAKVLEHGSTEGAKRHLDAAMELLTPRNLVRHGIKDDEGHALAKHHMHQVNRHRLAVMDIEDAHARNERLRAAIADRRAAQQGARPPQRQQDQGDEPAAVAAATPMLDLSARTAMLERTPAPRGRPGGPGLYHVKGMGHTDYLQQIVKALIEKRGMPPGRAYAIARGAIRKWMRGGGHVHPEVRAAAGRAEAGELARQARAHTHSITGLDVLDTLIELATIDLYNPYHAGPGAGGGRFTTSQGAGGQAQQQRKREAQQVAARKDKAGDRAAVARIRAKIAGLQNQLTTLESQLKAAGGTTAAAAAKTKGAAAAKTKAAAAKKSTTAAKKASSTAKTASRSATRTALRVKIAQVRQQIATLRAQLKTARLANDVAWAIDLAEGMGAAAAWMHEMRGPKGEWVRGAGEAAASVSHEVKGGKSVTTATRASKSVTHVTTEELDARLEEQRAEFMQVIGKVNAGKMDKVSAEKALHRAVQASFRGARIAHAEVAKQADKQEREKQTKVIIYHVGIILAGAVIAGIITALFPALPLVASLAIGASAPIISEVADYVKRLS